MAKRISPLQLIRRIILGIMLAGMTFITFLHQKMQGIPAIDAMDPFGGLETLMKYIAGGELIKKIEPGNIVLFGGFVVLSIVLARFFCGWFCAFGALQAVFGSLGKKLFGRRFTVPVKIDRILRWIKYPLLVGIIYMTWKTGTLFIRPYEPFAVYAHLSAGLTAVLTEFLVGFIILILVLLFSMLYERVFCKYLCPLGAVNSLLGRIPLFRIKRVSSTCISCSKCDKVCPMNIDVSHPDAVNSSECIACMECITACPTKTNSLQPTLGGKVVKAGTVVILGFAIYAAAALVGQATGMLKFAAPSLQSLAQEGSLKVEDIKGSSTYEMVAQSYNIELEMLYREVGIDMKKVPKDSMLKDTGKLAGIEGFEADSVRVAVAKILGIPYGGETGEMSSVTADTVKPVEMPAVEKTVEKTGLAVPSDFILEGTMTIGEVAIALKTTTAEIVKKLELPTDISVDKPLRDMKDQYGYTMPALKEKFAK